RFKIYIIDEAHMVTSAGFNALLKVVEEPPPHLKFIFATTEPEKVIGTIRSRTHHYPFRLIPPGVLREHLADITAREGIKVEPEVLPLVVRAGAGSARDAMSVLDQLLAGADESGVTYTMATGLLGYTDAALLDQLVDAFAGHDGAAVFRMVDQVVESGHDPRRFLADLLERFRDLVILNAVAGAAGGDAHPARALIDVPDDQFERMTAQARAFGAAELSRAADLVNTGLTEMRGATAPRLLLELVCARVLLPGADAGEQGLAARLDRLERRGVVLGAAAPAPMAPMAPQGASGGPRVVEDEFDEAPPMARRAPGPGQGQGQVQAQAQGHGQGQVLAQPLGPSANDQTQAPVPAPSLSTPGGALGAPPWAQDSAPTTPSGAASPGGALGSPPWSQDPAGGSAPGTVAASDAPGWAAEASPARPTANQPSNQRPDQPSPTPAPPPAAPQLSAQQPTAPQPAAAPSSPSPSGVDIRGMWPDLLEEVKRRDGRVSWMLLSQNAQVLGLDGDRLQVAFVNAGARDRFVGRGTADTLRQAAHALFGFQWQVDAIVDPSQNPGTPVAAGVSLVPPPPAQMAPPPGAYQAPDPAAYQAPQAQAAPPPAREPEPSQPAAAPPQQQQPQHSPQSPHQTQQPQQQAPQPPAQRSAPQGAPASPKPQPAQAPPPPPPPPALRPEDDNVTDDDEVLAEDNATAHELVIRELGAQRLDAED
ncbi:MAG: DNA polymerase III subunit gamma and tau, partial [Catenulispora sp.]|nr:DNA polymerase III subunit gamma and tau [Catenulispora sp.]